MTDADPFERDAVREAREQLYSSARRSMRYGAEPHDWLDHHAAQWALDRVSQREVDAIVAMVWGIEGGASVRAEAARRGGA